MKQHQEKISQSEWEKYQAFQKYTASKKRKNWLIGCGGPLILIVLIIIGISACTAIFVNNDEKTTSSDNSGSDKKQIYKLGETVKNGNLEVTVNNVETAKQVGPSILPTTPKDTFIIVDVKIKNKGNTALTVDSNMFKLKSGKKSLEADSQASISANQSEDGSIQNSFFLEQVNPDSITEGKVVFDVSSEIIKAKNNKLEVSSSFFSIKSVIFDLGNIKEIAMNNQNEQELNNSVMNISNDRNSLVQTTNNRTLDSDITSDNNPRSQVESPTKKENNSFNSELNSELNSQSEQDKNKTEVDERTDNFYNQELDEINTSWIDEDTNFYDDFPQSNYEKTDMQSNELE